MFWFVPLLMLAIAVGIVVWRHSEPGAPYPPLDPRQARQAATDLYCIQRKLDTSLIKHDQRQAANRLKREVDEVLAAEEEEQP